MHNQPESPDLFKEYMKRAAAHRAEEETRPDLPLSNNERQGHGHKPLYLQTLCLNKVPELATNISINTFATVNPDWDVQGTGSYHVRALPRQISQIGWSAETTLSVYLSVMFKSIQPIWAWQAYTLLLVLFWVISQWTG